MSKEAGAHRDVVSALGGSAVRLEPPLAVAEAGFLFVFRAGCCCRLHVAAARSMASTGGSCLGDQFRHTIGVSLNFFFVLPLTNSAIQAFEFTKRG